MDLSHENASLIRRRVLALPAVGSITVHDLRLQEGTGSDDEPVLRIFLTVSDPQGSAQTWPLDDVFELRHRVRETAYDIEAGLPYVFVELYPLTPDPEEDEGPDGLRERLDAIDR